MGSIETEVMSGHHPSAVLYRDLNHPPPNTKVSLGNYYFTKDGNRIFDASGGSACACLGHGNQQVREAIMRQLNTVAYFHTEFFTSDVAEELAQTLTEASDGTMSKFLATSSGSEAIDVAMKVARQYFLELSEPQEQRYRFIARKPSYHGATLGSLSLGGHASRRAHYEPMLANNTTHVSPCYAYRDKLDGETDQEYVIRLAKELDDEFRKVGPKTVCAFVAETIGGVSMGAAPPVKGYFKAMKEVCDKYGALLILDEVMCGVGRTGTMFAWQQEDVVPAIATLGKSLGGGYIPVAGVLLNRNIAEVFERGSGVLRHGQSFNGHPTASAAALEVQKIIKQDNLLANVTKLSDLLSRKLQKALGGHPNVGDIRGRGLMMGIELVQNRETKATFDARYDIGHQIQRKALQPPYDICVYPGAGCAGEGRGDNLLLFPPYTMDEADVDEIVTKVAAVIFDFFESFETHKQTGLGSKF